MSKFRPRLIVVNIFEVVVREVELTQEAVGECGNVGMWECGNMGGLGEGLCLDMTSTLYIYILLLSNSISSGALGIPGLLLSFHISHPTISLA